MTSPQTIEWAQGALRSGEVTSAELTAQGLRRIDALNEQLGAFIAVNPAAAEQAARPMPNSRPVWTEGPSRVSPLA